MARVLRNAPPDDRYGEAVPRGGRMALRSRKDWYSSLVCIIHGAVAMVLEQARMKSVNPLGS